MKKILLIILILGVSPLWGFEFYGVKSGMSKAEVTAIAGGDGKALDEDASKVWLPSINPWSVEFLYTADDKLWRMSLHVPNYGEAFGSILQGIALNNVLEEVCDLVEEKDHSIGSGSYKFTIDGQRCVFIDTRISNAEVARIQKEYDQMWTKK